MMKEESDAPKVAAVTTEMIDKAVQAVVDLIVETLKSKSPQKFAEAARLCNIGQSLIRTQAKRMTDFAVLEVEEGAADGDVMQAPAPRRGRGYFGANDQAEAQNEFMQTFGQNAQIHAEAQKATVAAQEAAELQTLTATRAALPENQRGQIDARIRVLLDNMEVRNNARQPAALPAATAIEPGVVPPVVPRGHPAGAGGAGGDDVAGVPAHANGAGGNGAIALACRIPEAAEALGDG